MLIDFPYPNYGELERFEVPDRNLMGVFAPQDRPDVDEEQVIRSAFEQPAGAPRLRELVSRNTRLLVLIDDYTRPTPVHRLFRYVLDDCTAAGMPDSQIEFLVAPGTHREMTEEEQRRKLGPFHGRFKLHQHHWQDRAELDHLGETSDGTPVTVNRILARFDFILGIGGIVPHRVKGFGGGAKIMFPGVSGPEMMYRNQWDASLRMSETVMGVAENPMRLRMEEAARIAGLRYIVNIVPDREGRIAGCFTGHMVAAHREGCRLSREINTVRLPDRADIVVVDSHPADRDFWQSAKGAYSGALAVRRGGTLILAAPNPEGVAANHPMLTETGYRPHKEIIRMVENGEVEDIVGAAILGDIAQIIEAAECVMVSPGVKPEESERIGFRHARNVQEALQRAFERHGSDASVAVLRHGGHILPQADPGVARR